MSQVSNVLMTFSAAEQPDRITEVNKFFLNAGYERGLVSIEDESLPAGVVWWQQTVSRQKFLLGRLIF